MNGAELIFLFLTAALAGLAWTWLITWFIYTFGNYPEDEEGRPEKSNTRRSNHETEQP